MSNRKVRWPELNRRQTRALMIGVALLALVFLYPPWVHEYLDEGNAHQVFAGFHLMGSPPVTPATYNLQGTHRDYLILSIELLGVAGFTYGALRTMADGLPRARRRHSSR
jgi:hypothetical protein